MVNGASGDDLGSGESKDITENNGDTMNGQMDFSENGLSSPCAAVNKAFKPDQVVKSSSHHAASTLSGVSSRSLSVSEGSSSDSTGPSDPPLRVSLISLPFTLHQWWYSWLITYMIMYVGTMNLWLDRVTDDM